MKKLLATLFMVGILVVGSVSAYADPGGDVRPENVDKPQSDPGGDVRPE